MKSIPPMPTRRVECKLFALLFLLSIFAVLAVPSLDSSSLDSSPSSSSSSSSSPSSSSSSSSSPSSSSNSISSPPLSSFSSSFSPPSRTAAPPSIPFQVSSTTFSAASANVPLGSSYELSIKDLQEGGSTSVPLIPSHEELPLRGRVSAEASRREENDSSRASSPAPTLLDVVSQMFLPITPSSSNSLGWAFLPSATAYVPLPFPVKGTCIAGKQYTVTSIQNLYELIPEIECVWTQAIVPNKVPMGASYGRLLTFANSAFLDYFIEFIYQGDYLMQTQCNGNYYNIGVLNFGGLDLSTGIWSISPVPSHYTFMKGEHYDGRAGVLMDFTVNVDHYCPYEGNEQTWRAPLLSGFSPFRTGTWPYRLFIDMLRAVGRDTDDCVILLGRTWMLDPLPADYPLYTVLYFTLKTCDPEVLPDFKRNDPLDPIPETYTYERQGVFQFLQRLDPFSFFVGDVTGTNPNGVYNYLTHANTDEQPSAGGGTSLSTVHYNSSAVNSDPHVATDAFSISDMLIKLFPDPATRTFWELVNAVAKFYST